MGLRDRIVHDLEQAVRSRDEFSATVLRTILAEWNNEEIAKRTRAVKAGTEFAPLTEDEMVSVVRRETKKRVESAAQYAAGNRNDLADAERREQEFLAPYLPQELSDNELRTMVRKTIAEHSISDRSQTGTLMGILNKQLKGKADMGAVARIAQEELSKG
jgi:hypothetical protein